ncbi:MAG: cell division protein SepF [Clostridiales bacterium]|nr:cell division protein SepF [Clostridiales bacterium]
MKNVLKSVREMFLGPEFEEEDIYEDYYEEVPEEEDEMPDYTRSRAKEVANLDTVRNRKSDSKILNFKSGVQMQVMITYPKEVAEASSVCDHVKDGNVCVVNLEGVERAVAQRIADFLGGAAYAINGEIERINNNIFVIAPANVHINGEMQEESASNILPWIASTLR